MIGSRLERLARKIVRPSTFDIVVSPAIADLQHEAPLGKWARVRGYAGAWRAVAGGLLDDIGADTTAAVSAMSNRSALYRALGAGTLAFAAWFVRFAWTAGELRGPLPTLLLLIIPSILPVTVLPAAAVAARDAARRVRGLRGYVLASVALVMLLFAGIDQGVTRANHAFRAVEGAARGIAYPTDGPAEMTVWALWRRAPGMDSSAHNERLYANEPTNRAAFASSVIAYVLLGIATIRLRKRSAAALLSAFYLMHFVLIDLAYELVIVVPAFTGPITWLPTTMLIGVAVTACHRAEARHT